MTDERIKTYTVIDVETPTMSNDSICSIGLVHVEDDKAVSEEYYLIDPECSFDRVNMDIHKITKAMVMNQLTFPEVWQRISKYFTNGIVVAHNAVFDLNVICKTLKNYKISISDFFYVCTLDLSSFVPNIKNSKLDTICNCLDIDLANHHNALSDAIACQKVFDYINANNCITKSKIKVYRFNNSYTKKADKPTLIKSLNSLYGIVTGIVADRVINENELQLIEKWLNEYDRFSDSSPFKTINPKVKTILSNRMIILKEKDMLINLSQQYLPENSFSTATLSMQVLMGILEGISCDYVINMMELDSLQQWMNDNKHLKGNYPFDTIFATINRILDDHIITAGENKELIDLFQGFLNPTEEKNKDCLDLIGKNVCLTGNFMNGTKDDIGELVVKNGGAILSGVTRKTDIVIVGGEGSKDWSYGNFGTKVKKAMELKSKGYEIDILSEEDFMSLVNEEDTV